MTQHRCRHKVAAFGEKVYFQHTLVKKDDYRKDVGVFLGMMDRSNTYLVANEDGVFASPNIMGFPDEQAFDLELINKVKVTMYEYIREGVTVPPRAQAVRFDVPPANPDSAPVNTAGENMCRVGQG